MSTAAVVSSHLTPAGNGAAQTASPRASPAAMKVKTLAKMDSPARRNKHAQVAWPIKHSTSRGLARPHVATSSSALESRCRRSLDAATVPRSSSRPATHCASRSTLLAETGSPAAAYAACACSNQTSATSHSPGPEPAMARSSMMTENTGPGSSNGWPSATRRSIGSPARRSNSTWASWPRKTAWLAPIGKTPNPRSTCSSPSSPSTHAGTASKQKCSDIQPGMRRL